MRQALGIDALTGIYARLAQRYDWQHRLITFAADQRGRRMLVEQTVREGDRVLDAGAGTGSTGLMAARKAGHSGKVTLFDLSDDMLDVAREKAETEAIDLRLEFRSGDMVQLPFADASFDVVLSTYSLCPLYDPAKGALELYRVLRPGGKLGCAHSAEPRQPRRSNGSPTKWKTSPGASPGSPWAAARSTSCPPSKPPAPAVVFLKHIGVPLWPFVVFVVEKPAAP